MSRDEIFDKLQQIFRDTFDDDAVVLSDSTKSDDIEDWDSLTQISILVAAENIFGIKLAISDTRNLKDIGALVDLIESKLK